MNPRTRLAALLILPALAAPFLHAQSPAQNQNGGDQQYQGENPDRYAMVRSLDGDVRITKGDVQDTLLKGTPVGEGDVVESSGRGVLQLADGTRLAFDRNTKFTVASLFKDENGSRQVLLRLDRGRMRVRVDDDSDARVRIDTPSGSVSSSNRATFNVSVDPDGVARITVDSGHVRVSNQRDDTSLGAGEQLSVFGSQDPLNRIRAFNTYDQDSFNRWSDGAWTVKRGESWDRVPSELRYYSDDLDRNGSWVYSDEYGWVWKPGGVAADWRPYYDGRWAAYPGGMTWISYDPWAYVTYHHGRWAWSAGGWFWIPGVYYSPAWVAWNYNDGYCGWAPLGYYNYPCTWGYGAWGGGYCWNVVSINYINVYNVNRYCAYDRVRLDAFNRGTGASGWTPNRGTTPPWRTRPLMTTAAEFRNPAAGQFNRAFQPAVERERFSAYQQRAASNGRQVYFQPRPVNNEERGSAGAVPGRIPFENRGALNRVPEGRPGMGRPDNNGRPGNTGVVPPDRGNNGGTVNRPFTPVPDRSFQPRPNNRDERGNTGAVPPRGGAPADRGDSNRRPVPDRAPDRSFERDFDRPAPPREAPRREAPPMREAPPQRFENRQPAPQREERPSVPSRGEAPRGNPEGGSRDPRRH
ncbi:MAG TPA: DUF6600 domain-containing protein [Holophagaceae bacterium]|jgi:hypothetical protein|nr:DUF6600 domain-containing protein [Holophagaceae bacterium]